MKRTERLFAIAEYLRGRRTGTTADQIADRFGVSVRTIYRDIDALKFANLPLETEQGRGGGVTLTRHYSMPPINFTVQEAAVPALSSPEAVRRVIESAWYDEAMVRITYSSPNKTSIRDVKIISVVLTRNETMLNCIDLGLDEPRQFKLHRISDAMLV